MQAIPILWHHDQMDVIRHQAIGPNFGTGFLAVFYKQCFIVVVILIAEKDPLTSVAALRDVMWNTGYYHSSHPGHN
jgi:hypothetical protein